MAKIKLSSSIKKTLIEKIPPSQSKRESNPPNVFFNDDVVNEKKPYDGPKEAPIGIGSRVIDKISDIKESTGNKNGNETETDEPIVRARRMPHVSYIVIGALIVVATLATLIFLGFIYNNILHHNSPGDYISFQIPNSNYDPTTINTISLSSEGESGGEESGAGSGVIIKELTRAPPQSPTITMQIKPVMEIEPLDFIPGTSVKRTTTSRASTKFRLPIMCKRSLRRNLEEKSKSNRGTWCISQILNI